MRTETGENIVKYLQKQGSATAKEMTGHFGISRQALFKHLAKLLLAGKLYKVGSAPKVEYRANTTMIVKETGLAYGNSSLKVVSKSPPGFLKPNFWFVNFEKLNTQKDKKFIIFQVLNHGRLEDWQWLFTMYSKEEIQEEVKNSLASAWFRQSLGLWQGLLDVKAKAGRFADAPAPGPWGAGKS